MNFATTKQRIIQYIDYKGITTKEFLTNTDIKRGFLDSDKLESTVSDVFIAKIIAKYPEISVEWLLTGIGDMLKEEKAGAYSALNVKQGIPMLPFDAFAGLGDSTVQGVNFDTIEDRYIVPLFDGIKVDFMLPVRGSSMYPKYSSGDVVACRLVTELLFVQWNKVYVIDSVTQGVIMKRLLKGEDDSHIICRSDNEKYGDFPVPMDDIRSIALVVGVIRLE